jgi:hypothetical protein
MGLVDQIRRKLSAIDRQKELLRYADTPGKKREIQGIISKYKSELDQLEREYKKEVKGRTVPVGPAKKAWQFWGAKTPEEQAAEYQKWDERVARHREKRKQIAEIRRGRLKESPVQSIGEGVAKGTNRPELDTRKIKRTERHRVMKNVLLRLRGKQMRADRREGVAKGTNRPTQAPLEPVESNIDERTPHYERLAEDKRLTKRKYGETYQEEKARARYRGEFFSPRFKLIVKYIFWLIIIGMIVFAIFSTTGIEGGIVGRIGGFGKSGLETVGIYFSEFMGKMWSQFTGIGEWKDPYAVEAEERKGIVFTEVRGIRAFQPDDKIEIVGSGIIHALERDSTVQFGCSMEGKEGDIIDKILTVEPNKETNFGPIICNLGNRNFDVKDVALYKKAEFKAVYDNYKTNANLKLYTMPEDELKQLGSIDPFAAFRITNVLLDRNSRTTRNTYDAGPIKISLSVSNRQPLVEGKQYLLMIGVDVDKKWGGKIEKGVFELKFPENIHLIENERYEKCSNRLELTDGMVLLCDFVIDDVEEGLSLVNIDAVANYNYEFVKETTVKISNEALTKIKLADAGDFS